MAIAGVVLPGGVLRLAASGDDVARLDELPYLRRRDEWWHVLWTHLLDLRRDLSGDLKLRQGSAEAIRAAASAPLRARRGDDAEVLSWFDVPPRKYQLEGIHAGLVLERLLLADQTGLGKSPQAIGILLGAHARGLVERSVILCPASLKLQWLSELERFARPEFLPRPLILAEAGPRRERYRLYRSAWRVLLLNPELLVRDRAELGRVLPGRVGLTIIDEAKSISSPESKTTDAVLELLRSRYRVALTATPIENGLVDLWSVLRWVDPRLLPSKERFEDRHVVFRRQRWVTRGRGGKLFVMSKLVPKRYVHLEEVRLKMRPAYLRRTAEEADVAKELPEVVHQRELVELGASQREVYERVRERTKAEVERLVALGVPRGAVAAPLTALREAADSTELVPEGEGKRPASAKLDRLKDLLHGELRGEKVLVFTLFERMARAVERALRDDKVVTFTGPMSERERASSVERFVRGSARVMVATSAAERGLNLQVAGFLVNFDLPWNPAVLKQRIGRLRRLGSTFKVVRSLELVARGTVEETLVLRSLEAKRDLAHEVVGEDELSGPGVEGISVDDLLSGI